MSGGFFKRIPLTWFLLVGVAFNSTAQITVDDTDFANAGDTVRMSVARFNQSLDYQTAGTGVTWDYSTLEWQSQYIDTFLFSPFANPFYSLYFSNIPFNPYRSNIAMRDEDRFMLFGITPVLMTDVVNYFYKNTQLYRQAGIGATINGIPSPIGFDDPDVIYRFPLDFGNKDTSNSDYNFFLPSLGTYTHVQKRLNDVDGWGTLVIPYGTFDVLKQVSDIYSYDSLYIDTFQFGIKTNNIHRKEYKWLGKGHKEPLLQINTQFFGFGGFATERITRVVYRDSVRFEPVSGIEDADAVSVFNVYPNPANDVLFVEQEGANSSGGYEVKIYDLQSRLVLSHKIHQSSAKTRIDISALEPSNYLLLVEDDNTHSIYRKEIIRLPGVK